MRRHDSGLTLVEMLVASLILSVVLIAVAGMMISMFAAQRTVSAVTQATTAAQAAASNIATGVRNASDLSLTTPSGTTNQLLVVRTANNDVNTLTWSCKAWYFSSTDGSIRTKTTANGTKITAPAADQLATWTVLVDDVTPRSGAGIFTAVAGGIEIAYDAQISEGDPVVIQTTATKRSGVTEAGTCF